MSIIVVSRVPPTLERADYLREPVRGIAARQDRADVAWRVLLERVASMRIAEAAVAAITSAAMLRRDAPS